MTDCIKSSFYLLMRQGRIRQGGDGEEAKERWETAERGAEERALNYYIYVLKSAVGPGVVISVSPCLLGRSPRRKHSPAYPLKTRGPIGTRA